MNTNKRELNKLVKSINTLTKKSSKKSSMKSSKKTSKKSSKKTSKKVPKEKHILCKNNICANTRTIFHSPRMKNTKEELNKIIYYFYNLDDKKLYRLRKEKYDILKDKRGYLLQISYRYFISDFDKTHKLSTDVMVFIKYTKKEDMSELAGISSKTPYGFGWNYSMVSRDLLPKSVSIKDESKTVDKSKFENYIKESINSFKQEFDMLDLSTELNKLNAYVDTYDNLLDKYYKECVGSTVDVFKIKNMA